jgi:hypothetical protein
MMIELNKRYSAEFTESPLFLFQFWKVEILLYPSALVTQLVLM